MKTRCTLFAKDDDGAAAAAVESCHVAGQGVYLEPPTCTPSNFETVLISRVSLQFGGGGGEVGTAQNGI